jgi:drug/metabolite transporter (DMT)-like permease
MPAEPHIAAAVFALLASLSWGTSDFTGGYASKTSDSLLVTFMAHAGGLALMTGLSLASGAAVPGRSDIMWAMLAGALGGLALATFYHALSSGKMGLAAPVAAVLGAAIPALVGIASQGVPTRAALTGVCLAAAGIWLISRPDESGSDKKAMTLALMSGIGFAGFFLCIHRTGASSALWSAAFARVASVILVGGLVLARRREWRLSGRDLTLGLAAGCVDSVGTYLFVRADQAGRLDSAVILTSLYPAVTVLLARVLLREHFTRWKVVGILAALVAVPLVAWP